MGSLALARRRPWRWRGIASIAPPPAQAQRNRRVAVP